MTAARKTRTVKIGSLEIGGANPVRIQSMTTTPTREVERTIEQIERLTEAGCEIVRVACPQEADVLALGRIKQKIRIPLVADIHFSSRFALMALDQGVDKLRINPGNLTDRDEIARIIRSARPRRVPIRIGINGGSLEKDLMERYGPRPEALVESARRHVRLLEESGFEDIVLSLKTSDVPSMIAAYRLAHESFDYPLHLGVTEAGTLLRGSVANAIGIGALLLEGIGDTLRVSLTADPVEEIRVAKMILESLGLRRGVRVISCPTCGRAEVDVVALAEEVERRAAGLKAPVRISVMGCTVNGPGEAAESDFGITGGKKKGVIYVKGRPCRTVDEEKLVDELFLEIQKHFSFNPDGGA